MKAGIDYIGITVVMYCHDGNGNLLLQKRSKNCRDEQGHWDCGGGAIEFGETFEEAVQRELMEEYGSISKDIQFAGANNVLRTNQSKRTHWVAILFAIKVDPKKVKNCEAKSIDELGWFTENKLPHPLHSMYLTHLNFVKPFIYLRKV